MISLLRHNNKRAGAHGFTMIELVVVVVLIGVLAAIAVPLFGRSVPRLKSHADARNILNSMRTARSRAISENEPYGVFFDTGARNYIVFKDKVNPSLMTFEVGDSIVIGPVNLDGKVVYSSVSFANNTVVMMPTGAASQTGNVNVNSYGGDAPFSISVLAATGKTKLQ